MFSKRLSRGVAVTVFALSCFMPLSSLDASHGVATAMMVDEYRNVNYRYVELNGVPHQCYDVEVTSDGGLHWEFYETVCSPI